MQRMASGQTVIVAGSMFGFTAGGGGARRGSCLSEVAAAPGTVSS